MSAYTHADGSEMDRRERRTHDALQRAFAELFLGRRYDEIKVGDIVEEADVGRSTFYEHYRDKDDLLVHSMSGFFDILADAATERADTAALEGMLRHFWENRDVARYLFSGPPARDVLPRLIRALAERIEPRLDARIRAGAAPVIPVRLIALQAAEAQFGLIRSWLAGQTPCDPADLADGLRRSSSASVSALLPPDEP